MATEPTTNSLQRALLVLASLTLGVACLYFAQKVLIPLVLAILLTFVLSPLMAALQRRGLPRTAAALLVVLFALVVLGAIGWAVTVQVDTLLTELPKHKETISDKVSGIWGAGQGVFGNLLDMIKDISARVQESSSTAPAPEQLPVIVQPERSTWLTSITLIMGSVLEVLATLLLVLVLVVFMLLMKEDLRNRVLRLAGHGRLTHTTKALNEAGQRISNFLFTQSVINIGFGICLTVGLFLIGIPYALLWGVLATLLRFIPYLGIWLAMALPILYSVAVFPGWFQPLAALVLFGVLELITSQIVEPFLLGHSTGISPVALLLAAAFWTWLWGPIGLVLSTPLTTCLVVLGKYVSQLEFLDVLLGDQRVLDTDVSYYQRLLAHDQDEAVDLVESYLATHPAETVFDEILLPALLFVRRDQERGELSAEDGQHILEATRQIIEDLPLPSPTGAEPDGSASQTRQSVLMLGCPARDQIDEIALLMWQRLVERAGCQVEVLSAKMLSAEVIAHVRNDKPTLVCLASLPPGGQAQTRYLCKRLRTQFPDLKIAVGRWGQHDGIDRLKERLTAAGANYVSTTLLESRTQVLALLPVMEAKTVPATDAAPSRKQAANVSSSGSLVSAR
jgi:predicted PurR-regulated permease PerM